MKWTLKPFSYMGHDGMTEALEIIDPAGCPHLTLDLIGQRQEGGDQPMSKEEWKRTLSTRAATVLDALNAEPPALGAVSERPTFEEELRSLINRHSKENGSDTPDYILANYLDRCLEMFDITTRERERWYGRRGEKPVVQVLEEASPDDHTVVLHGDEERKGVVDRWYWSCRCGATSKRENMTIEEARLDHLEHVGGKTSA